jgi:hypothetical protein
MAKNEKPIKNLCHEILVSDNFLMDWQIVRENTPQVAHHIGSKNILPSFSSIQLRGMGLSKSPGKHINVCTANATKTTYWGTTRSFPLMSNGRKQNP